MAVKPQTSDQLMSFEGREFILVAGKDGVGKSSAMVSLAIWATALDNEAKFYFIDTENGFRKIYKGFGREAPENLIYYKCADMDEVLEAFNDVEKKIKPGDWLGVESMSTIWDHAQDLGYMQVSGKTKRAYIKEQREKEKKGSPTPSPDLLWPITKNAHDAEFVNVMLNWDDINVVWGTTIAKVRDERSGRRENRDRADFRREFGIDSNLQGFPKLPYVPDTVIILDRTKGMVFGTVLKDRGAIDGVDDWEFEVEDKSQFAMSFWEKFRA